MSIATAACVYALGVVQIMLSVATVIGVRTASGETGRGAVDFACRARVFCIGSVAPVAGTSQIPRHSPALGQVRVLAAPPQVEPILIVRKGRYRHRAA